MTPAHPPILTPGMNPRSRKRSTPKKTPNYNPPPLRTKRKAHRTPKSADLPRGMADYDRDGVPDIFDCQPFDPNKDGWWGDAYKKVTSTVSSAVSTVSSWYRGAQAKARRVVDSAAGRVGISTRRRSSGSSSYRSTNTAGGFSGNFTNWGKSSSSSRRRSGSGRTYTKPKPKPKPKKKSASSLFGAVSAAMANPIQAIASFAKPAMVQFETSVKHHYKSAEQALGMHPAVEERKVTASAQTEYKKAAYATLVAAHEYDAVYGKDSGKTQFTRAEVAQADLKRAEIAGLQTAADAKYASYETAYNAAVKAQGTPIIDVPKVTGNFLDAYGITGRIGVAGANLAKQIETASLPFEGKAFGAITIGKTAVAHGTSFLSSIPMGAEVIGREAWKRPEIIPSALAVGTVGFATSAYKDPVQTAADIVILGGLSKGVKVGGRAVVKAAPIPRIKISQPAGIASIRVGKFSVTGGKSYTTQVFGKPLRHAPSIKVQFGTRTITAGGKAKQPPTRAPPDIFKQPTLEACPIRPMQILTPRQIRAKARAKDTIQKDIAASQKRAADMRTAEAARHQRYREHEAEGIAEVRGGSIGRSPFPRLTVHKISRRQASAQKAISKDIAASQKKSADFRAAEAIRHQRYHELGAEGIAEVRGGSIGDTSFIRGKPRGVELLTKSEAAQATPLGVMSVPFTATRAASQGVAHLTGTSRKAAADWWARPSTQASLSRAVRYRPTIGKADLIPFVGVQTPSAYPSLMGQVSAVSVSALTAHPLAVRHLGQRADSSPIVSVSALTSPAVISAQYQSIAEREKHGQKERQKIAAIMMQTPVHPAAVRQKQQQDTLVLPMSAQVLAHPPIYAQATAVKVGQAQLTRQAQIQEQKQIQKQAQKIAVTVKIPTPMVQTLKKQPEPLREPKPIRIPRTKDETKRKQKRTKKDRTAIGWHIRNPLITLESFMSTASRKTPAIMKTPPGF